MEDVTKTKTETKVESKEFTLFGITLNLRFNVTVTASKLLAYLIFGLGSGCALMLKDAALFMNVSMLSSAVMMGKTGLSYLERTK